MNVWRSIAGMLEVELISADIASLINTANDSGIILYKLQQVDGLTAHFFIQRCDYDVLNKLSQKKGDKIKVKIEKGMYWKIEKLLYRPIILIGFLVFFFILLYLPTRVLFVKVEGNNMIPERQILEAVEKCGVHFGATRSEVRSEKVKNAILSALPELQWAGINTKGCVAIISVRERAKPDVMNAKKYPSNIVAGQDGVITSCTILEGNPICSVGQVVKEGQTLISGFTDCGLSIRVTQAEGEIYAQTNRKLTVITSTYCLSKSSIIGESKKISLLIGKKRINLWKDSGIWDTTCDRMYKECYVRLPGGYKLPLGIAIETGIRYQFQKTERELQNLKSSILSYGKTYLENLMVAGNIVNSNEKFVSSDGLIHLFGDFICIEMIGRVQRVQIGEENGENDGTDR